MISPKRQSQNSRDKKQRSKLFVLQGGKCFWCGCDMVPVDKEKHKTAPPNMVTLHHLDSRNDPRRGSYSGQLRKVAACWKCNHDRGIREQKQKIDEHASNYGRII